MTAKRCGCNSPSCGCCEGTRKITPVSTANRPGLGQLSYRIGTHGAFFETMKARLGNMVVEAAGPDGQTIETFYPLKYLTTRQTSDPTIALLDGWATVGDVLTFYQERIANEGYLRTATERRSVLELARLVGYKLRPGVASTVFLAYTLEDTQIEPVEIPTGARSQSVPGPGELPQSFETSEKLLARREWNNLQVRLQQPQDITLANALFIEKIYVAGINTNLKTGDMLLLVFGASGEPAVIRTVASIATQFEQNRTEIRLQPLTPELAVSVPVLMKFIARLEALNPAPQSVTQIILTGERSLLAQIQHGVAPPPSQWIGGFMHEGMSTSSFPPDLAAAVEAFQDELEDALANVNGSKTHEVTNPTKFVQSLLKPHIPQAASSLQLGRSLKATFQKGSDAPAQLLVNIVPVLKDNFYTAWANADINPAQRALKALYVMRLQAPLFGANVPDQPTYYVADVEDQNEHIIHVKGELKTQDLWLPWPLSGEADDRLFLDQAHEEILPSSYVMIQKPLVAAGFTGSREVYQVKDAQSVQRTAYGTSGKTTMLKLAAPWWTTANEANISQTLRKTLVFGQSEELTVVEEPLTDPVQVTAQTASTGIVLDGLYDEFTSGRWIILSGERADIQSVSGVKGVELLMVSGLLQVEPTIPGDKIHTALLLATPTAYSYKRDTLTIYGNVVKATHGETTNEPLGSGDGSQALQSFVLKQPPLTFVPAPTAAGVESTLRVYVNNVEWHEADTLAGLGPKDRKFVTKTDDTDKTTLIFGNGIEGSRIPTGVLNVNSTYRRGIGKVGNVRADQISLLQTKPLGVNSVINPLKASGGADKEDRDQARENAPLAVMALDRLVSLQDYADFTRTFAGIGKASGRRLSDSRRQFIHLTIAGVDDIPIEPTSDLYRNLLQALRNLGDVSVPVQIDSRELIILVLSARICLQPDYLWDPVILEVRVALFEKFGFRKRALGQPALLCEIIACIQAIEGVAYVDVDAFGGVPEKVTDQSGNRQLQSLDDLAEAVQKIVTPPAGSVGPLQSVMAKLADFEGGALHPAQLAIFTPGVQDTIVLNQIK
ncbi:MAG TPA: putative baseplate assembly protein [Blastocatellia bacterium]|nr:putative baseplate assembly protein [Blastocatellia bacterium]